MMIIDFIYEQVSRMKVEILPISSSLLLQLLMRRSVQWASMTLKSIVNL